MKGKGREVGDRNDRGEEVGKATREKKKKIAQDRDEKENKMRWCIFTQHITSHHFTTHHITTQHITTQHITSQRSTA